MIDPERIHLRNSCPILPGAYVLYCMQASIRAEWNHALEYAVEQANALQLPVVVLFAITNHYPEANARHFAFMLEGLPEIAKALEARGIRFVVRHQEPVDCAALLAKHAALVVTDRAYVRVQRGWNSQLAGLLQCRLVEIESEVVVPVETVSAREEFAAYTIRPKIHRLLEQFLRPVDELPVQVRAEQPGIESLDPHSPQQLLNLLSIDRSVGPVTTFRGGTREAKRLLELFIDRKLGDYAAKRNDPTVDFQSHLSPYLAFGQISPLYVALRMSSTDGEGTSAFLEEFIVRRELSMNFCHFNPVYDTFDALPTWAKETLGAHARDARDFVYTAGQWENASTHDSYWNAAQKEMTLTGKMHGYMRMYWGKKLLEWSASPEEALQTALALNNKYELDGRSPNGFCGVAWCFGKHDRPWAERPVFGMIRYMNANGLRRKFDADAYVRRVALLEQGQLF